MDQLLQRLDPHGLPRPWVVQTIRQHLAQLRKNSNIPDPDSIASEIDQKLADVATSRLQPVINATGILAHTNLGRAPLCRAAIETLTSAGSGFCNLELDLISGERGRRGSYVEDCLALASGAEAATVVNNGAAAVVLMLRSLTTGPRKEVIISRGELVQIGGGFRIHEILETSGAVLREVGTTNRTSLTDYADAISPQTALILRVHRSNFFMEGFVESPPVHALADLARAHSARNPEHTVPVVEDLGSGALVDLNAFAPVENEPLPGASLRAGVNLVCFSADKLLGGPQAGIILGSSAWISRIRKDPFFRALRCDKLILMALQATVEEHLRAPDSPALPMIEMLKTPVPDLRARAERIAAALQPLPANVRLGEGKSQIGGGVCPRSQIPSVTVIIQSRHQRVDSLAKRLRRGSPPVIGFIADDAFHLDLRTVPPASDPVLIHALHAALRPT